MHPLINGLFVRNSNLEVNGVVSTKVSGCNFVLNALTVYPHCELIIPAVCQGRGGGRRVPQLSQGLRHRLHANPLPVLLHGVLQRL